MDALPFKVFDETERAVVNSPAWRMGVMYGDPRPGHPEGAVLNHVNEVLVNVEKLYGHHTLIRKLRLIALVHDAFKFQVDSRLPRCGENHHGWYARRFAEQYTSDDEVLDVIELHDEAFNAWQNGVRDARWDKAERRVRLLIARLGAALPLYLAFFKCDNTTGSKEPAPLSWFHDCVSRWESEKSVVEVAHLIDVTHEKPAR